MQGSEKFRFLYKLVSFLLNDDDETPLNHEKLAIWLRCNTTKYPDNLACRGRGRPYYNSGVRQPGVLVVRGWRYFTLFLGVTLAVRQAS